MLSKKGVFVAGVTITVQGSFDAFHPAERATVHLRVGFEGPEKSKVHALTTRAAAEVSETISAVHAPDSGPVTWWSSDQLRVWAERPWNKDGKQLPLVHHAAISFQAKFSDFERLGSWISQVSASPGVSVDRIDWALTEARRLELTQQARDRAVRDARDKAQAYADSLQLGRVHVVALADPGMLGNRIEARGATTNLFSRGASASGAGGGDVNFLPEDIQVAARVEAIFTAE